MQRISTPDISRSGVPLVHLHVTCFPAFLTSEYSDINMFIPVAISSPGADALDINGVVFEYR